MALEDELAAAIDKDLPNQVGRQLRAKLEKAESDEMLLAEREKTINRLSKEVEQLRKLEHDDTSLTAREEALVDKEREMELREYKLTCREEYAEKGRADMHMMMGTIFHCPEARSLAFSLYGNQSGYTDNNGTWHQDRSVNLSGEISDKPQT
jgi:hypothetical protein